MSTTAENFVRKSKSTLSKLDAALRKRDLMVTQKDFFAGQFSGKKRSKAHRIASMARAQEREELR